MSSDTLEAAVLQLNSQGDVAENLAVVERLVGEAAASGAKLVVLPENFAFMGPEAEKRRLAEPLDDPGAPIQAALSRIAARNGVTLIAGGFPEQSPDAERPFNTSLVVEPSGRLLAMASVLSPETALLRQVENMMSPASRAARPRS